MTGWTKNEGSPPSTGDKPLRILWANKETSKWTYRAKDLNWTIRGEPFDVIAVEVVK